MSEQDRHIARSKHITRLLAGHDQKIYRLPSVVVRVRLAADRAAALLQAPAPPSEQAVWRKLVEGAVAAFLGGESELPDAWTRFEDARIAAARWELDQRMRNEVSAQFEQMLADVIADQQTVIIEKSLQPALAALVVDVSKVAALLPEVADDRVMLVARDDVRKAWIAATEAAKAYAVIRRAWDALSVPAGSDEAGEFRELSNVDQIWRRSEDRNLHAGQQPPWPSEEPHRLLYLVRHHAQLIVPTAAQRQQLWEAKYGDRFRELASARHADVGFGALLGA
jgi:hypothetical protein